MSQNKVYEGLKEIGGEGTTTELREHLAEKFPDSSLPEYVQTRLRQLEEKDIIEIDESSIPYNVRIVDHSWEGIQDSLADRDFPPQSKDD